MSNDLKLELHLNRISSLWKEFCERHTDLYELTCDEYMHLLSSDIDSLGETVEAKKELLNDIARTEEFRKETVIELYSLLDIDPSSKLEDLLNVLKAKEYTSMASEIEKYNLVLLDIIDKIQEQNKKNQLFLNKAIISLQELKDSFKGKKNFKTYSSLGVAKSGINP